MKDAIVEKVRRGREQNAAQWGCDLKAILADARKRQADSGHRVALFAVRKKIPS